LISAFAHQVIKKHLLTKDYLGFLDARKMLIKATDYLGFLDARKMLIKATDCLGFLDARKMLIKATDCLGFLDARKALIKATITAAENVLGSLYLRHNGHPHSDS
jgi:myo-inositol-1-phosphate synthase